MKMFYIAYIVKARFISTLVFMFREGLFLVGDERRELLQTYIVNIFPQMQNQKSWSHANLDGIKFQKAESKAQRQQREFFF